MGWAQATTLIVQIIAVLGAIVSVAVTYALNQRSGRRERQAKAFAEALAVVEDFATMPYRIRRRANTPEARHEISIELDKIQSGIAFQQAWLRIEAKEVAIAYDLLISAARNEAGLQMKEAWTLPPPNMDDEMLLGRAYPRAEIDAAREECIEVMSISLSRSKRRSFARPPARARRRAAPSP
jgi:hypothetical protein